MTRLARILTSTLVIAIIVVPLLSGYTGLSAPTTTSPSMPTAFIDPLLLDPASYVNHVYIDMPEWFSQGYLSALSVALAKGERIREGQVKVVITASPNVDLEDLSSKTRGLIGVYRHPLFTLVEAWVTRDDVELLSRTPGVYSVALYRSPLAWTLHEQEVRSRALDTIAGGDAVNEASVEPSMYKAVEVIGAKRVWEEFGVTGKGAVVAVVDTGVDFGSPGLGSQAIARTPEGVPMIFDSDEAGLTLTLVTSTRDEAGFIKLPERGVPYFDGWFLTTGITNVGWVYYRSPAGRVFYTEFPLESYHVGGIESASGVYRFGLAVQFYAVYGTLYWTVPILYVDSETPGVYDNVYADLSTMYYYLLVALNATGVIRAPPESTIRALRDFSFADEKPAMYGDEVLARDFTGDGVFDLSVGALAGYLYDWTGFLTGVGPTWSWLTGFDYTGLVLPGMDSRGFYVTIAYDFNSHGTSVANVIASRYEKPVDLGYGTFPLKGIAPDALIAANTGLINPIASVFFFSGHDLRGPYWEWAVTGRHKADIISNSWGSSFVLLIGFASSVTNYALLWDHVVSVTKTIIVHAGGNGAPGYGTMTTPGDSAFAITLGASTLFDYRPVFGFLPGTWDDVVSWSARGPTNVGLVKPDLVNIGSFEWAFTHTLAGLGNGIRAVDLFGGTSEATPMTSGSVALIVSYLKGKGLSVDPGIVKAILKSTARDLGYNAYVQGAGHVDVYGAFEALVKGGVPVAYSTSVAENLYSLFGFNTVYYPVKPVVDTQLYTGPMKPGESKELKLDLTVYGEKEVEVNLSAVTFTMLRDGLVRYLDMEKGYAVVAGRMVPLKDVVTVVGPDFIEFKLVRGLSRIVIPVSLDAFKDAELVELVAYTTYGTFDPFGRAGRYIFYLYAGLELHYGVDVNDNGVIELGETQRINYDIRQANVLHATIGKPFDKFKLAEEQAAKWLGRDVSDLARGPVLDLRILGSRYPADTPVTFYLELRRHFRVSWDWLSFSDSKVIVKPGTTTSVNVTVEVPPGTLPGFYEGYVIVDGPRRILVPVSVQVAAVIGRGVDRLELSGWQHRSYNNYAVEGQFDWSWRYESADWRSFPVIVEDPSVAGYVVTVRWSGLDTTMDLAVAGLGPTLLTIPGDTPFYGAVYAAKLNWPPYYPSHGIQAIYDSPMPKRASVFAPDYGFVLERLGLESRPPFWVIVKNPVAEASRLSGYPEQFTLIIVPVRVEAPIEVSAKPGEPTSVPVRVYGSYSLSGALAIPFVAEGLASVSVTPEVLPIGFDHRLTVTVVAEEDSLVVLALLLRFSPQVSIGYNMAGTRVVLELLPGLLLIPIGVKTG